MKLENSKLSPLDPQRIQQTHNRLISEMGLPKWLFSDLCPSCKVTPEPCALRGIELKTNAQFFGNVVLEFLCTECNAAWTVHYPKCCSSIEDLCDFLKSSIPSETPQVESFYHGNNNLMDAIYKEDQNERPNAN